MTDTGIASIFFSAFGYTVVIMMAIIVILWVILPFFIFGIKGLLIDIIGEQREANRILREIADYIKREKEGQSTD